MNSLEKLKVFTTVSSILITSNLGVENFYLKEEIEVKPIIHNEVTLYQQDIIPSRMFIDEYQKEQKQLQEEKQLRYQQKLKEEEINNRKIKFNQFIEQVKTNDTTQINLREPSGLTVELSNEILIGTGLEGLGDAFVNAEKEFNVNAYYLMAHAAWESQWGESRLAKNKNNLFGYLAYDADPYNSAKSFNTKDESIYTVAKYISSHYLDNEGDHFNGSTLVGMNVKYATDKAWAKGIGSIIDQFVYKAVKLEGV